MKYDFYLQTGQTVTIDLGNGDMSSMLADIAESIVHGQLPEDQWISDPENAYVVRWTDVVGWSVHDGIEP